MTLERCPIARGQKWMRRQTDTQAAGRRDPRVPHDADALHGSTAAGNGAVTEQFSLGADAFSAKHAIQSFDLLGFADCDWIVAYTTAYISHATPAHQAP